VLSFAELDRDREQQGQTDENSRPTKQLKVLQSKVISSHEQNLAAPSGEFMRSGMLSCILSWNPVRNSSIEYERSTSLQHMV
jgi:hypothetical protein